MSAESFDWKNPPTGEVVELGGHRVFRAVRHGGRVWKTTGDWATCSGTLLVKTVSEEGDIAWINSRGEVLKVFPSAALAS